jgi:hypothetical protein
MRCAFLPSKALPSIRTCVGFHTHNDSLTGELHYYQIVHFVLFDYD